MGSLNITGFGTLYNSKYVGDVAVPSSFCFSSVPAGTMFFQSLISLWMNHHLK